MKKNIKYFLGTLMLGATILNLSITADAQERIIKISVGQEKAIINDIYAKTNNAPYIQKQTNSVMIPLKFVPISFGIAKENISYDDIRKKVTIKYKDDIANFICNTNNIIFNGIEKQLAKNLGPVAEIKDGAIFMSVRSLAELFGFEIKWEPKTKTTILSNKINDLTNAEQNKILSNKAYEDCSIDEIIYAQEEVIRLVNDARIKYGLKPLEIDQDLMELAEFKSTDMYENEYFSHISPKYGKIFKYITDNLGYSYTGENIARYGMNPEEVTNGWLASPSHRENILDPNFKYIGVAVRGTKWTQIFVG